MVCGAEWTIMLQSVWIIALLSHWRLTDKCLYAGEYSCNRLGLHSLPISRFIHFPTTLIFSCNGLMVEWQPDWKQITLNTNQHFASGHTSLNQTKLEWTEHLLGEECLFTPGLIKILISFHVKCYIHLCYIWMSHLSSFKESENTNSMMWWWQLCGEISS